MDRRQILKSAAALLLPSIDRAAEQKLQLAGQQVEVRIAPVSRHTVRISVVPIVSGSPAAIPSNGSLIDLPPAGTVTILRSAGPKTLRVNGLKVGWSPFSFSIGNEKGETIQHLKIDAET